MFMRWKIPHVVQKKKGRGKHETQHVDVAHAVILRAGFIGTKNLSSLPARGRPIYSSFLTESFTVAVTSRCSFTGISNSPMVLIGSASAILRLSMV